MTKLWLGMQIFEGVNASSPEMAYLLTLLYGIVPAIIGYLIGSINPAVLISRCVYHEDIREKGSGNAGTTNMMRTYGKGAAIATFLLDLAKTAIAVFIGALWMGENGAYIGGFAAMIGHVWPVFFHFRGGKGVACAAMLVLCTEPVAFLALILMFIGIVAATKFISLGSVMCVMLYPLVLNRVYILLHHTEGVPLIPTVVSFFVMVVVILKHRENIQRLMKGKESKFSFKKSVKPVEAADEAPVEEEPVTERTGKPNPNTSKKKQKKQNRRN